MNFSNIKKLIIPEGSVTALSVNGIQLWSSISQIPEAPHDGTLICTDTAYMLYDDASDKVSVFRKDGDAWETYHNSLGVSGLVPVYGKCGDWTGDEMSLTKDYFIAISNFRSYHSYDGINFTELTSAFDNLADYKALSCYYNNDNNSSDHWNIIYNKNGRNYKLTSTYAYDSADWSSVFELPGGQTQIDETWKFMGCVTMYGEEASYYTNSENTFSKFIVYGAGVGDGYYDSNYVILNPICIGDNVAITWTKNQYSSNTLIYTNNGQTWHETSFDTVDDASIFCYNNGTFVWSQPHKDVSVKYSTDGITWSDSSLDMALTSISADGNGFMGIRDGVLYRSTNGINWKAL